MHVFLYFCICTCSAQLSMFHVERRSRNTLIIIIIIKVTAVCVKHQVVVSVTRLVERYCNLKENTHFKLSY